MRSYIPCVLCFDVLFEICKCPLFISSTFLRQSMNSHIVDKRIQDDVSPKEVEYIYNETHGNMVCYQRYSHKSGDDLRDEQRLADCNREQTDTAVGNIRLLLGRPSSRTDTLLFTLRFRRGWNSTKSLELIERVRTMHQLLPATGQHGKAYLNSFAPLCQSLPSSTLILTHRYISS